MSRLLPIHHTFAPLGTHAQRGDALRMSYAVWRYKRGKSTKLLRSTLEKYFGAKTSLFASGREGLYALLMELKERPGDEVIVQGYTCVVLPNAIRAAGLKTVYVDIERDTLNLSLDAVREAITPNTKAIICQHTFGIPAPAQALRALCDERGIVLIEDCAHILPDATGPKEIGRYGDAILISFGRDKAISGVAGGAIVCRRLDIADGLAQREARALDLSWWTIARFLEYPQIYAICRPFYGLWIGKAALALCNKLRLLIPILSREEKHGVMAKEIHRMPNACAYLAVRQLARLQAINDHRRRLTSFYVEHLRGMDGIVVPAAVGTDLPLQKFPLFLNAAPKVRRALKKFNIHLDDGWTGCVVCPANISIDETGYEKGADPEAETVCEGILSLPTHPGTSMDDAKEVLRALLRVNTR